MSDDSYLQPISPVELTPAELAAIRARVADGVFLGGNYEQAYEQFLIAHRDRCALLARLDELQRGLPHTKGFAKRFRLERVGAGLGTAVFHSSHLLGQSVDVVDAADFDAVVDDAARFGMRRHKNEERYLYMRNHFHATNTRPKDRSIPSTVRLEWDLCLPRRDKDLQRQLDEVIDSALAKERKK
jgi:hypothetical protein